MPLAELITAGDVAGLRRAILAREVTIEAVMAACLDRIRDLDSRTNAVIAVNDKALDEARRLDARLGTLATVPRLYGLPVLVKDNIETRELPTTAGSLALRDNFTGRDAPIIESLRASGAIMLGKANLSEWANFRSRRSSSGWSAVGGQTRNPHDLSRSPCGSSSGSAVGVAAGLAPLAIGTETNGSVVCPAHVNGVVGIKPTVGMLPAARIVPISHSQDTAGPMARDVVGAAHLLSALHGSMDFTAGLDAVTLAGKRLGVVRSAAGFHEGVDQVFGAALETLRAAGAEIIDDLALSPGYASFRGDTFNILLYEFKHGLNAYLGNLPNDLASLDLARLIEFNLANRGEEMCWFQQEIFVAAQAKGGLDSTEYTEALERAVKATRQDGIDGLIAEYGLDALVAPTGGPAWAIDLVNGDHSLGSFATYPAVAGYPHVTVPMGDVHGLPVGLSFTASRFHDEAVIGLAHGFERAHRLERTLPRGIAAD